MLTTQKTLAIITEQDDAKRNAMIDKLKEDDVRQLSKILSKSARDSLATVTTGACE